MEARFTLLASPDEGPAGDEEPDEDALEREEHAEDEDDEDDDSPDPEEPAPDV